MTYNQILDWYLNFRRALDRLTRMATVVALVISGVWGAIAWAASARDPMFRVLSVRSTLVQAALVSFSEPRYRTAVEVRREPLVEPKAIESPRPHVMPRYAQLPDLSPHAPPPSQYRHDIEAACRSCVSPYCRRLYRCGERR
jgi:hypothetical protein